LDLDQLDLQTRLRIAESMTNFGNTHPIVVDEHNVIIGGHGRLEAAKRLKLMSLPAIRVGHLTPEQKRALALAENKLAELSSWDNDVLAAELKELTASAIKLNFDDSITGFDTDEIDQLIGPNNPADKADPADKTHEGSLPPTRP
jgi:ParB-like chromosome segregation protein Spo0J